MFIVVAVGCWWLLSIKPMEPEVAPDSLEAWRGLIQSESRPVRLAAAILLTSKSDDQGLSVLLEMWPSLAPHELSKALAVLVAMADKIRLDPALIDLFLNASDNPQHQTLEVVSPGVETVHGIALWESIKLIPPGGERTHLNALQKGFDRVVAAHGLNVVHPSAVTWYVLEKLIATGDRESLLHCEKVILNSVRRIRSAKATVSGSFYRHWAALVLGLHPADPIDGFNRIEKNYPAKCIPGLQRAYLRELGKQGYDAALIDLWLQSLPDDPQGEQRADDLDWAAIWAIRDKDKSLRTATASALARLWPDIGDDQKARLGEIDRDHLLLAYARLCERQATLPTREAFLRLLEEPAERIVHSIQRLHESGEKDLRQVLIQEALKTKNIRRGRDALYALHYWLGGIPESVRERWQLLLDQTTPAESEDPFPQNTSERKAAIAKWLHEPTPQRKIMTPGDHGEQHRESRTPWVFRRSRVHDAMQDMRELEIALAAYWVDHSGFPPAASGLTSPISYIEILGPDICAWRGPYAYVRSWRWSQDYALASAGPDGVRDIGLLHFLLTQELEGRKSGEPLERAYVRFSRQGYESLETFTQGSDRIVVYDRSIF